MTALDLSDCPRSSLPVATPMRTRSPLKTARRCDAGLGVPPLSSRSALATAPPPTAPPPAVPLNCAAVLAADGAADTAHSAHSAHSLMAHHTPLHRTDKC